MPSPDEKVADKKEDTEVEEENESKNDDRDKESAKARKATESITNYHMEKEIDAAKAAAAVAQLGSSKKKAEDDFSGEIKGTDVAIIVDECDLPKDTAEKLLKKAGGDLKTALESFLRQ